MLVQLSAILMPLWRCVFLFLNAVSQVPKKPQNPAKCKKKKNKHKKNPKNKNKIKQKNQDKNQKKLFIQNAIEKWKEYSFEQIWINVYIETWNTLCDIHNLVKIQIRWRYFCGWVMIVHVKKIYHQDNLLYRDSFIRIYLFLNFQLTCKLCKICYIYDWTYCFCVSSLQYVKNGAFFASTPV